jgi:hypothetical protein
VVANFGLNHVGQPERALVAVNLLRIGAWLAGVPRAKTRQSAFATLMTPVA